MSGSRQDVGYQGPHVGPPVREWRRPRVPVPEFEGAAVAQPGLRALEGPLTIADHAACLGILGDRRPAGGNVLTANVLAHLDSLFPHTGPRVIYGETTRLGEARLREAGITFKQIPYDIKAR